MKDNDPKNIYVQVDIGNTVPLSLYYKLESSMRHMSEERHNLLARIEEQEKAIEQQHNFIKKLQEELTCDNYESAYISKPNSPARS